MKADPEARAADAHALVDARHVGPAHQHGDARRAVLQRLGGVVDRGRAGADHADGLAAQRVEIDVVARMRNEALVEPAKHRRHVRPAQALAAVRQHDAPRRDLARAGARAQREDHECPCRRQDRPARSRSRSARRSCGGTSADSPSIAGAGCDAASSTPPRPNCASNQARNVRLEKPNAGPVSSGGERSVSMRAQVAHGPSKPAGERSNTLKARIARHFSANAADKPGHAGADHRDIEHGPVVGMRARLEPVLRRAAAPAVRGRARRRASSSASVGGTGIARLRSCGLSAEIGVANARIVQQIARRAGQAMRPVCST